MTPPRLRPGRETVARNEVDDFQRARILSAMVEVAAEFGYIGASVAPVVARAGVSRRTFYELFEGREDCFLGAFEWGVLQAREVVVEAYASQRSWRERVRHALTALLALLEAEPQLARVLVIDALGAGKLVLARRRQVMDELIAALDADAPQPRAAAEKPLLTAEGIVGGAFSVIHGRLLEDRSSAADGDMVSATRAGDARPLLSLHGQLMALIALPYLGPRAAGEELTRAAPAIAQRENASARVDGGSGRMLERLDMRLTYRTVRCLMFIGEHPGSSNREIARGAEMSDEGQTSKLLSRLTRLGLIANSQSHGPGFPNRWMLTPQGEQMISTVQGR